MFATASSPPARGAISTISNAQAQAWCEGTAAERPWPEDHSISVREAFERERGCLIALPGDRFPADERVEVTVDDADLVGLRAPVDSRELLKTFHGISFECIVPTSRYDAFRSLYWRSRRKLPTGRPSWPGTEALVPPRC